MPLIITENVEVLSGGEKILLEMGDVVTLDEQTISNMKLEYYTLKRNGSSDTDRIGRISKYST